MKARMPVLAGFLGFCLYALAVPATVHALVAAHLNYNGCDTCHGLHGAPSQATLLDQIDAETTCLSCHGPLGIATEASVHDPKLHGAGNLGYITCLGCHNPHTNGDDLSVPRTNSAGGYNIKLIGREADFKVQEVTMLGGVGDYKDVVFEVSPDDWSRDSDGFGLCNTCHGATHNVGKDCTGCHKHNDSFKGAGCTGCHDGLGAGALGVSVDSPHSTNTIFASKGVTFTCEDCHTAHSSGTIEIPNNPDVGINYGANSETGIALGSAAAPGGTEAEICWNCHDLNGVSEWGTNTHSATGNSTYDYGSLDRSDWPSAVWSSANFSYKEGPIASTHAVDGSAAGPGLDPVDSLRCSYCHDVHELAMAPHDTAAGKPYLRGTWMGNPYREDGAPSNIAGLKPGDVANYSAYDVAGKFGAVPRGGPTYTALGGYFIDQNSGSPTSAAVMDSPDKFAGLCLLCHEGSAGTAGDGQWQAAEIASLDMFPGNDWVTNGNSHGAVVKGGGGIGAANLFTSAKRHQTAWVPYSGNGTQRGNPVMAYRNARSYNKGAWETSYWAQGLRGTDASAFGYAPRVDTAIRQLNYGNYSWGATVVAENADGTMTDSGIDSNFHQFTCSKCHNPHASRLPRLMLTNCLDTKHNSWDDAYVTANDTNLAVENRAISLSQATSAQNCHRLADPLYPQARPQGTSTGGWNRVTPW